MFPSDISEPINTLISYNLKHQPPISYNMKHQLTESLENQRTWDSMFWHNLSITPIH